MPADVDWYREALERKGALRPCEACGQTVSWAVQPNRGLVQTINEEAGAGIIEPGHGIEVVRASCPNCGLLRLFVANTLLA